MGSVSVCETFTSIQGESSYAGLPCFFIRLAGCNLRCRYCDTPQAYGPGRETDVRVLVEACRRTRAALAEVTGGEPLLQAGFPELARALRDETGKTVLVETNGSLDISVVPAGVVTILDVKCPGSGEQAAMDFANFARLRPADEVKFVLSDRKDYEWARQVVEEAGLAACCRAVHFGVAAGALDPARLAEWLVADGLPVRLHLQRHRLLGMK